MRKFKKSSYTTLTDANVVEVNSGGDCFKECVKDTQCVFAEYRKGRRTDPKQCLLSYQPFDEAKLEAASNKHRVMVAGDCVTQGET